LTPYIFVVVARRIGPTQSYISSLQMTLDLIAKEIAAAKKLLARLEDTAVMIGLYFNVDKTEVLLRFNSTTYQPILSSSGSMVYG